MYKLKVLGEEMQVESGTTWEDVARILDAC